MHKELVHKAKGADLKSSTRSCIRCGIKIRMQTAPICDTCAAEVMTDKRRGNIFVSFFFIVSVLIFVYLYFFKGLLILLNYFF